MHNYDLNVILDPNLSETQLKLEKDAITAQIERVEGQVSELDEWGNKRLAYPIRKLNEGYYLIYKLSLSETAPRQLATNLRLRDNVMRVLVTRDRPEQRTRKEAPRTETRPEPRTEARTETRVEPSETPPASA
jgi:small subunit ribosomal protein S6